MKKFIISAVSGLIMLIPVQQNVYAAEQSAKKVEPPVFSRPGGFYDEEFDLSLSAGNDCMIYYTLDGSEPTTESILYTGPIHIYDRTPDKGILSQRTDITLYGYTPPENIDTATVIRAAAADSEGIISESAVNTYFVNYSDKAEYYKKWKVISLVTDSGNLFGDENGDGIYILGKEYNDWLKSDEYDDSINQWLKPANYLLKGAQSEREAVIQIIENGKTQLSQNIGIRIHGGATRSYAQKSFRLYARSRYGKSKIKYNFFSDGKQKYDTLILRNGGNDSNQLRFRDKLNQGLVSDRAFLNQKMEPCVLFINGEYWGHYEITERISADYIKKYTGIKEEDLFLMKDDDTEAGTEDDIKEFNEFNTWLQKTDFSDPDNYQKLCDTVDMQDYIDYISSNIYMGNLDWVWHNVAWFKERGGKYRFIMFDAENNQIPSVDENVFGIIRLFNSFISRIYKGAVKNEEFRQQFCTTFMDISNNNFNKDIVSAQIDKISSEYMPAVFDYYYRFSCPNTYSYRLSALKNFYNVRFDKAVAQLKKELELKGEPVNVEIENDNNTGAVTINTITPEMDKNNCWCGRYFTDYPVRVSANPAEGYRFSHFELSGGEKIFTSPAEISFDSDIKIKAIYKRLIKGDVSGNEAVDIHDAIEIARYLMKSRDFTPDEKEIADFNGDGKVNIRDVIDIAKHMISNYS